MERKGYSVLIYDTKSLHIWNISSSLKTFVLSILEMNRMDTFLCSIDLCWLDVLVVHFIGYTLVGCHSLFTCLKDLPVTISLRKSVYINISIDNLFSCKSNKYLSLNDLHPVTFTHCCRATFPGNAVIHYLYKKGLLGRWSQFSSCNYF